MPFTAPQKSPAPRHGVAGLSQLIKIMCGDASAVLLTAAFTIILRLRSREPSYEELKPGNHCANFTYM